MRAGYHPIGQCVPETHVLHFNFEYAREKEKKKGRWNHLLNAHVGAFKDTQNSKKLCYMLYITRFGHQPICQRTCNLDDDDKKNKVSEWLTNLTLLAAWTIAIAVSTAALRRSASATGRIAQVAARRVLQLPSGYQNATAFGLLP